jgi:hypothetical protein
MRHKRVIPRDYDSLFLMFWAITACLLALLLLAQIR